MYHGGGGFKHEEVYNMPTWMRKFHIKKIQQYLDNQEEQRKKQMSMSQSNSKQVMGPNIKPTSTYNFKK